MNRALKQRLLGAAILAALLVILVPEWLDGAGHASRYPDTIEIPDAPVLKPMDEVMEPKTKPPVKPKKSSASAIHAWALQVGSFQNKANALVLRDRLRAKGYPAYVDKKKSADKNAYKVRIGPELDRARLEKLKKKVLEKEKIKGMVVKHP